MLVFTWIRPVFCDVFPPRFVGTWLVLASGFLGCREPCKIGFVYLNVSADTGEVFRIACIFLIKVIYIFQIVLQLIYFVRFYNLCFETRVIPKKIRNERILGEYTNRRIYI